MRCFGCFQMLDVGLKCHVQKIRGAERHPKVVKLHREQLSSANVPLITGLLMDNYETETLRIANEETSQHCDIPVQSLRENLEVTMDGSTMGDLETQIVLILIEDNEQLQTLTLHGTLVLGFLAGNLYDDALQTRICPFQAFVVKYKIGPTSILK